MGHSGITSGVGEKDNASEDGNSCGRCLGLKPRMLQIGRMVKKLKPRC